jgi:hypothetical protein
MNKDIKYQGTFTTGIVAKVAGRLDGFVTSLFYTPIDLLSLFDKVIVHEVRYFQRGVLRDGLTKNAIDSAH